MGSDDIFKKKRKKRTLKKQREEKRVILLALEDTKSSRYYFEKLIRDKELLGKVIIAKNIGTNPNKVIDALLKYEKDNNINVPQKWIIIDKDDYSKEEINGAIKRAKDLGICVAFSNEAYEVWVLLHFKYTTSYLDRFDLKKELNGIFENRFNIEYEKGADNIYELTVAYQKEAIKNAKKLIKHHQNSQKVLDIFSSNPITFIYELVECLNNFYENQECKCFPLSKNKEI